VTHSFGSGEPFTVGIEEELLLVEPADGHRLADVAEEILPRVALPGGAVGFEAYAAELELRSPPEREVAAAVAALMRGRGAIRAAGATPMAAGLHPAAALGEARLVREERYERVKTAMRDLIQRTPECALHVHVGMPDPEIAIRAYNALRTQLPLLAALAANSPFWFGRDSGMASARAAQVRAYPGRGVPRPLHDYAEYEHVIEETVRAGGIEDYTHVWWDVRLHPRLGTLEVREMDAQTHPREVAALAALVRALAREAAERDAPPPPAPEALAWSAFRAGRDGLDAELVDEHGDVRPARAVAADVIERLDSDELEPAQRLVGEGNGAAWQRSAHDRGGMAGLLQALTERTAARLP
jgi:carboxylate-amine ligase